MPNAMEDLKALRGQALATCGQMLAKKQSQLQAQLADLQESSLSETKSSAGDKYETGRERLQQEMNQLQEQLQQVEKQQQSLFYLEKYKTGLVAKQGSLVKTNRGFYFLSVSLGALPMKPLIMALSPVSPLGELLLEKQPGDEFSFRQQPFKVEEIA